MIQNIVFDMGNVLLSYDPKPYVAREIPDPEAGRLLFDACFGGPEWKQLDAGAISEEEALLSMQSHIPQELRGDLARVFAGWPDCMSPVPGMEELVAALQEKGFRCLVLSNASVRFPVLVERFSVLRRIEERFVSAYYHLLKPSREIYERFLQEFSLNPQECLFFDDLQENVDGAIACGIHGHRFCGKDDAVDTLRKAGIALDFTPAEQSER